MRAISLWQPWASAVALGAKRIETRHWSTDYRGPLAIHAAKRRVQWELEDMSLEGLWCNVLEPLGKWWVNPETVAGLDCRMPFGAVVAVCDLVDCRPVETFGRSIDLSRSYPDSSQRAWTERDLGNYEPGRFGWVLDNIKRLPTPIPFRGGQSFFQVPEGLIAKALS